MMDYSDILCLNNCHSDASQNRMKPLILRDTINIVPLPKIDQYKEEEKVLYPCKGFWKDFWHRNLSKIPLKDAEPGGNFSCVVDCSVLYFSGNGRYTPVIYADKRKIKNTRSLNGHTLGSIASTSLEKNCALGPLLPSTLKSGGSKGGSVFWPTSFR